MTPVPLLPLPSSVVVAAADADADDDAAGMERRVSFMTRFDTCNSTSFPVATLLPTFSCSTNTLDSSVMGGGVEDDGDEGAAAAVESLTGDEACE